MEYNDSLFTIPPSLSPSDTESDMSDLPSLECSYDEEIKNNRNLEIEIKTEIGCNEDITNTNKNETNLVTVSKLAIMPSMLQETSKEIVDIRNYFNLPKKDEKEWIIIN
jgi:hypothetical protein